MSTPGEQQGPTPIPVTNWATYNAAVLQIRNTFYDDQQSLRKQRDDKIKAAQEWYRIEIVKLQAKYEADMASARAAFKPLS